MIREAKEGNWRRDLARYALIAMISLLILAVIWIVLRTFVVNFMPDARPI
jgi:hypothetical protein